MPETPRVCIYIYMSNVDWKNNRSLRIKSIPQESPRSLSAWCCFVWAGWKGLDVDRVVEEVVAVVFWRQEVGA
jgi:hypothetical protein